MRKSIGTKSLLYPQPVLVIGTYDKNENPDIMTAAWGGVADANKIFIVIDQNHKTMKNILLNKQFTVSIGTRNFTTNIDYVGLVSQNDNQDKIKQSGFHTTPSSTIKAPLIDELPLALECELISFDESTDFLFAKVLNVSCDESILKENGKIDVKKLDPISYDSSNHAYITLGEVVGKAFEDGKKLM